MLPLEAMSRCTSISLDAADDARTDAYFGDFFPVRFLAVSWRFQKASGARRAALAPKPSAAGDLYCSSFPTAAILHAHLSRPRRFISMITHAKGDACSCHGAGSTPRFRRANRRQRPAAKCGPAPPPALQKGHNNFIRSHQSRPGHLCCKDYELPDGLIYRSSQLDAERQVSWLFM